MIMVAIMTEIFGEYTAALTRVTERLLPRRRLRFLRLSNLRLSSRASSSQADSFLVYF
ncbi:hypothetical protein QN277_015622 [Acacia crassicarpa]|uniref:Uncharacterized protein n=1 Tax=Acacia crassicarpa TaxID=499986 RepID=A0AAE1MU57_9FABA|nr:hypothetical protein QN277_015622 [Acacia crassicarpa]